MRYFTKKEDKYLRENYLTIPAKRMAANLGRGEATARQRMKLLGIIVPQEVIEKFKKDSQIKPGTVPPNKGKKWKEFMSKEGMKASRKTTFKKGNLPPNTKEDGAISIRRDKTKVAYPFIRTSLGVWEPLQRVVWMRENGNIPKGSCILFKDGNPMNCDIKNLECVNRKQLMQRNTVHNLPKPIAQLVQLRGALNRQIRKHEKQDNGSAQSHVRSTRKAQ